MVAPSGIITLLTDFGTDDAYVGAMKGAILAIARDATLVDISHAVRPFAVLQAAYLLDSTWRSFPQGTVHLVVVDPGVGSARAALGFEAGDHFFVGPDNGLFSFLVHPIQTAVVLTPAAEASATFHGRDVFAPAAARLAQGTALKDLGSPHQAPLARLDQATASKVGEAWQALVIHCDRFGNAITNLPPRSLSRVRAVNGTRLRAVRTYEDAEPDELVALIGSSGRVEFALRQGSAAARLQVMAGDGILVT